MKYILQQKYLLLLLILSLLSILPFFREGFFTMHDDTQVARVSQMGYMLAQGVLPVRWVPDLGYGYGYPIFNFYAPFAYYVGGMLMLIGFTALIATKLMMVLSIVTAGVGMYLLAKELWGKMAGLVAGLLYLYAPYHALNTYVRGDAAELYAYAIMPFLFWGGFKLYKKQTFAHTVTTAIAFSLLILSHNLSAMMVTPFFLLFSLGNFLITKKNKKHHSSFLILAAPLIGILLASFYWMPVFVEMKYTNVLSQVGGAADFRNHFVCLSQLWSSPWLYGGSIPGCIDGMSYRIGKLHILLGLIGIGLGLIYAKREKEKFVLSVLFALGLGLSIFLLLPISTFLWEAIPHMAFFQYPWRFLLISSFFISLLGGSIMWYIEYFPYKRVGLLLRLGSIALISLVLLITSAKIFIPQTYLTKSNEEYINEQGIKAYASSLTDEYLPPLFVRPKKGEYVTEKFSLRSGKAIITNQKEERLAYFADIIATSKTEILIHHAYFPTWHVYINGKMSEFGYFNRGLIVTLPKGTYNIVVRYSQTPIERVANSISLVTVGMLLLIAIYPKLKKNYAK